MEPVIIERSRGRRFMRITAELREDHERLSDGFSVTGELYEPHGTWSGAAQYRNGRECDSCGNFACLHDEIRLFAPELGPVIDVHLADPDGVPMHAEANGWYFYSGAARATDSPWDNRRGLSDHERAAEALNIPPSMLPKRLDREQFAAFCQALRAHWAAQAAAARAVLVELAAEAVGP